MKTAPFLERGGLYLKLVGSGAVDGHVQIQVLDGVNIRGGLLDQAVGPVVVLLEYRDSEREVADSATCRVPAR